MEVEVVEVVGELGQELVDGVRANGGRDPLASVNAWVKNRRECVQLNIIEQSHL